MSSHFSERQGGRSPTDEKFTKPKSRPAGGTYWPPRNRSMFIGLTYDLREEYLAAGYGEEETAEFDRPETVEAIQAALDQLGHRTDRIGHARQLIARLAQGDRWDLVVNFAEGLYGIAREAQVPAILDVYQIPYTFSDPLVMAMALDKGLTKVAARSGGVPTADFAVVREAADVGRIDLGFPLFAKPLAEGTGKGISPASKVRDRQSCGRSAKTSWPAFTSRCWSSRSCPAGSLPWA